MTDGGCAASSRALDDTDLMLDSFAAGEAAQKMRDADYVDAFAARLGERYDADTAASMTPILAALAQTIRTGLTLPDGD